MLPKIWIIDTYSLMFVLGVIACLLLVWVFFKKINKKEKYIYDILLLGILSVMFGLVFAVLFQILFDAIKGNIRWNAMTFYGGLVGGVIAFVFGYNWKVKKLHKDANFIHDIFPIAPAAITIAHAFGRIGCFLAGCCYGVETDSIFGVQFPHLANPVYPTQLYEAIFLFILSSILFITAMKKRYIHNLSVYLLCYGVFRFCLEFLRGDARGELFLNLSPSQGFSIIAVISSVVLYIIINKKEKNRE